MFSIQREVENVLNVLQFRWAYKRDYSMNKSLVFFILVIETIIKCF